ncbi:MAG: NUDIX domain-containing protein [bacterium]|nr:NUDIX domain-containing protein [bacterium]
MPHINKDIDFVVGYYLVFNDRVLLVYHRRLDSWACPGGHIEPNEDIEDALFREIYEEMGINRGDLEMIGSHEESALNRDGFKSLPTPAYVNIHRVSATHRHIALQYFLRSRTDVIVADTDEHALSMWFSEGDLDDPSYALPLEIKFYALQALACARYYAMHKTPSF